MKKVPLRIGIILVALATGFNLPSQFCDTHHVNDWCWVENSQPNGNPGVVDE